MAQGKDPIVDSLIHSFNDYTDSTVYDFNLPDEVDNNINLSDLQGKVVLLNFWSTGCGPCINAIPDERKLHRRISRRYKDVAWINISTDRNTQVWKNFLKKKSLPGINVICNDEDYISGLFHVDAYPAIILLNKQGNIIGYNVSGADESKGLLLEYLISRARDNVRSGDALQEMVSSAPPAKKFVKKNLLKFLL